MSFNGKENPIFGVIKSFRTERRISDLRKNGAKTYIGLLQEVRGLRAMDSASSGRSIEDQVAALYIEYKISDTMHRARQLAAEMVQHRLPHPAKIFIQQRINRRFFPETDPSNYHGEIFPDGKVK